MQYLQLLEVVASTGVLLIARSAGLLCGHSCLVSVSGIVSLLIALPRSLPRLPGRLLLDLRPIELRYPCMAQERFITSKSTIHQKWVAYCSAHKSAHIAKKYITVMHEP